jgi:hypothetical protein
MFGGIRGWLAPPLCTAALLAIAVIAGCSGDDEQSTANEGPRYSAATEEAGVFIQRMAKLLETTADKKDCAQLEEINGRSVTRFTCPVDKA